MTPLQKAAREIVESWDLTRPISLIADLRKALADEQAQMGEPMAWVFLPNRELLWPSEVEAANPMAIGYYKPLYDHPAVPSTRPLTVNQILAAFVSICDDRSAPPSADDFEFVKFIVPLARAIEAAHKIKGGA